MTNELSGVKKTQARAEQALRELMLSGERISQYAVEKRAGLANGTLNYNCPEYRLVRESIRSLKKVLQGTTPVDEQGIAQQIKLKEKYRRQRNELREEIKKLMAENVELLHNFILLQQYVRELERSTGREKGDVISFPGGVRE
ncbi:hypothetical protein N7V53_16785 [Kosakonia sp. HypNH10]|uniref:hypothetical protein n=1 Tax=Kosakonia sp. HypNH10 TaxID=2980101 RepID=UPI002447E406|nr:hypothetical protein [Kosakonia sp. HypNH10]MDH2914170.1 hypothetical protein [Kosakonia sp. HypNH10]